MQCVFSPLAILDLEEIGDYIARDNPSRAVSFIKELRERCAKIMENPQAAPLRNELGEGIRMVTFGHYLIFYTVGDENVRIERILHGARATLQTEVLLGSQCLPRFCMLPDEGEYNRNYLFDLLAYSMYILPLPIRARP